MQKVVDVWTYSPVLLFGEHDCQTLICQFTNRGDYFLYRERRESE